MSRSRKNVALRTNLVEQVKPQTALSSFQLVIAFVICRDSGFHPHEGDSFEPNLFMQRCYLRNSSEVPTKSTTGIIGGVFSLLQNRPYLGFFFNPGRNIP